MSYEGSDFEGLPEYEFEEVVLLKRIISFDVTTQEIKNREHKAALDMVKRDFPLIPENCIQWRWVPSEKGEKMEYFVMLVKQ